MKNINERLKEKASLGNNITNVNGSTMFTDKIRLMNIDELVVINDQPFKEYTSQMKFEILKQSIERSGITNPLIVRKVIVDNSFKFYILSGRHRYLVAKELNIKQIPCIVKSNLSDDEANLILIEANLCQREELLPSEKAFAYKQQYDILKRQGKRNDLENNDNKTTREKIALATGSSPANIGIYIRLTSLIPNFLNLIDNKQLGINVGHILSYISKNLQQVIYDVLQEDNIKLNLQLAKALKECYMNNDLTQVTVKEILNNSQRKKSSINSFKVSLLAYEKYFSNSSDEEITSIINKALDFYFLSNKQF